MIYVLQKTKDIVMIFAVINNMIRNDRLKMK